MNGDLRGDNDYSQPYNIVALIISLMYLSLSIATMILIFRGWLKIKHKTLHFVILLNSVFILWQVLQLFNYSHLCFPFLNWVFSVLGGILSGLISLGFVVSNPGNWKFLNLLFQKAKYFLHNE